MGLIINSYSFAGLDAITVAWLAQLTTSFGSNPSAAFITALDTMIKGMRTDGDLLLLDRFWIFAQEVQGYSRVSIVNPSSTQITEVNTPTWTASQGYTGNASNMYLNTNYTPSTQGVNYILDSACLGFYSRTNTVGDFIDIGGFTAGSLNASFIYGRFTGDVLFGGVNKSGATLSVANTNSTGLFAVARTASNLTTAYKDGASIGTSATVSTALTSFPLFTMAGNFGATPISYTGRQYSMAFTGSGSINQANFNTRFSTFRTAIGF